MSRLAAAAGPQEADGAVAGVRRNRGNNRLRGTRHVRPVGAGGKRWQGAGLTGAPNAKTRLARIVAEQEADERQHGDAAQYDGKSKDVEGKAGELRGERDAAGGNRREGGDKETFYHGRGSSG